jgi:hypothetical protein
VQSERARHLQPPEQFLRKYVRTLRLLGVGAVVMPKESLRRQTWCDAQGSPHGGAAAHVGEGRLLPTVERGALERLRLLVWITQQCLRLSVCDTLDPLRLHVCEAEECLKMIVRTSPACRTEEPR